MRRLIIFASLLAVSMHGQVMQQSQAGLKAPAGGGGGGGAVAFRSSAAIAYAARTNTTVTAPTGITNGDLLVYVLSIGENTPPTPTPPTGFTVVTGFPVTATAGAFNVKTYVWWKIAASESGNYTATHTSASSEGYVAAFTGANATTPFSPSAVTATGTGSTTTVGSITTPANSSAVMFISQDWADNANSLSPPTGTTPTFTTRVNPSTTSGVLYVADGVLATAGATGTKSITNNTVSGAWMGALLSIRP